MQWGNFVVLLRSSLSYMEIPSLELQTEGQPAYLLTTFFCFLAADHYSKLDWKVLWSSQGKNSFKWGSSVRNFSWTSAQKGELDIQCIHCMYENLKTYISWCSAIIVFYSGRICSFKVYFADMSLIVHCIEWLKFYSI